MKFVHDENHNRHEALDKQEVYNVLAAAIQSGELPLNPDEAFITQIKSEVDGKTYKIAFCTNAKYLELKAASELIDDCLYIITDEDPYTDLANAVDSLQANVTYVIEPTLTDYGIRITALENKMARTEQTITISDSGTNLALETGTYLFYLDSAIAFTFILHFASYTSGQKVSTIALDPTGTYYYQLEYVYNENSGDGIIYYNAAGSRASGTFKFFKL